MRQMRLRLHFPEGLPAFESQHDFRLEAHDPAAMLFELRAESSDLSFYLLPVTLLDRNYDLALSDSDRTALGFEEPHELLALALVTLAENLPPTANLLAPVVVDLATGRGVQAVRDDARYSHQHPLIPAAGEGEKQCS
jgi:flagellar assembly factor FliW